MEARGAVDAVLIQQRQRRIAERRRPLDERFGQGRAPEERKRGSRVQLDIHERNHEDTKGPRPPQSKTPSRNHCPTSRSTNSRYTVPSAIAMSHSSRSHGDDVPGGDCLSGARRTLSGGV